MTVWADLWSVTWPVDCDLAGGALLRLWTVTWPVDWAPPADCEAEGRSV